MAKQVYLAQAKCVNNHCILASAGEYEDDEAAKELGRDLETALDDLLARKIMKRECAICRLSDIYIEIGRTHFTTLEEAKPHLLKSAVEQRATAIYLNQTSKN